MEIDCIVCKVKNKTFTKKLIDDIIYLYAKVYTS